MRSETGGEKGKTARLVIRKKVSEGEILSSLCQTHAFNYILLWLYVFADFFLKYKMESEREKERGQRVARFPAGSD
jgi:hypothetical protein